MLSPDFKEFVELLEKHNAEYLVVGGYAVGIHGRPRYTGDLDVWVNPAAVNAKKVLNAVNEFGFSSYGLTLSDFEIKGNILRNLRKKSLLSGKKCVLAMKRLIYRPYGTLRTWGLLFVLPVFCPYRGSPVRDKILVESIVGFFIKSR